MHTIKNITHKPHTDIMFDYTAVKGLFSYALKILTAYAYQDSEIDLDSKQKSLVAIGKIEDYYRLYVNEDCKTFKQALSALSSALMYLSHVQVEELLPEYPIEKLSRTEF
ncbi:hypothetical protein SAMN06298216_4120 [Spirosomataceae bacterium TFI 002]|nr:hypothetical protein SAMN06298216_4120 [Spirosomataceae bacterium TFI 002]